MERDEEAGESNQTQTPEPAVLKPGDGRLIDTRHTFKLRLRIAETQSCPFDYQSEIAKPGQITSADDSALVISKCFHGGHGTRRAFAPDNSMLRLCFTGPRQVQRPYAINRIAAGGAEFGHERLEHAGAEPRVACRMQLLASRDSVRP